MADSNLAADLEKADEMWRLAESQVPGDHSLVYNFLKELDVKYPNNVNVKWRLARACKDMSETPSKTVDTSTRRKYAYEGKEVAMHAVQLDGAAWEAQMFLGALLGVCSRFEIFHKLGSAREMKECFQKACDLAGDRSPEPYHCLGAAEHGFADAGHAARLMGLKGTYESAYDWFMKAESLCPHECYQNQGGHYNRNWLMIVKSLTAMGRKEEAMEWRRKLLGAEVNTPDDRAALAEVNKIKL
jgi:tetratricopeptide (TPR) repeat protein